MFSIFININLKIKNFYNNCLIILYYLNLLKIKNFYYNFKFILISINKMKFLKKIINLFFILFVLTIIIYLSLNNSKNNLKLRYLETPTEKDIEEICKGAPEDLYNYYYKKDNYTVEEKEIEGNKENVDLLIKIINNEDLSDNGKKYVLKNFVWLLSIVLSLITFISLFFIICCDCCNCCCGTQCCKGTCSRVCLSFITAGLFGVSFVLNLTTVSLSPKTFKGLNGASCSLFHFIDDIEKGESKETTPKWGGFTGLQKILSYSYCNKYK